MFVLFCNVYCYVLNDEQYTLIIIIVIIKHGLKCLNCLESDLWLGNFFQVVKQKILNGYVWAGAFI